MIRVAIAAGRRVLHVLQSRRIARFVAVGCAAAGVHWGVVVALVGQNAWHPLTANVLGWLVAFVISFAGHHLLTFRDRNAPLAASAGRFFIVSAGGFCVNEAAYALLLGWSNERYELVLAVVLIGVAAFTYLLSLHWAFRRSEVR